MLRAPQRATRRWPRVCRIWLRESNSRRSRYRTSLARRNLNPDERQCSASRSDEVCGNSKERPTLRVAIVGQSFWRDRNQTALGLAMMGTSLTDFRDHTASPRTPEPVPSGWYAVARPGVMGVWDGQAWTGTTRPASEVVIAPVPQRHLFGFLKNAWFLLLISGWLITLGGGDIGTAQSSGNLWWLGIVGVGLVISVYGLLLILEPHLRFPA